MTMTIPGEEGAILGQNIPEAYLKNWLAGLAKEKKWTIIAKIELMPELAESSEELAVCMVARTRSKQGKLA